jgi:hypothetical protein
MSIWRKEKLKTYSQTLHHLIVSSTMQRSMTLSRFGEISSPANIIRLPAQVNISKYIKLEILTAERKFYTILYNRDPQ